MKKSGPLLGLGAGLPHVRNVGVHGQEQVTVPSLSPFLPEGIFAPSIHFRLSERETRSVAQGDF